MKSKIWLSSPHMGGKELQYIHEAFNSNWIAPLGPHVDGFETEIGEYLGEGVQVAALSSGTAALHLALVILGVKSGDEVICQSMTFAASANPIIYQGATPVFIDSENSTWNMSPEYLEDAIEDRIKKGRKPKAIIVVHLYGMPAHIDKVISIASRYEIPLIEDAAEAFGSTFQEKPLGNFGTFSILSFNGNKIITTSGGGALISTNVAYINKARFLATQALDQAPHYQHSQIGYNYRMSNICAAIGRGQLQKLQLRVQQRRSNFGFYREAFADIEEIQFQEEPNESYFSNRWLTAICIEGGYSKREELRQALVAENIDCRPVWKPMHLQPVYAGMPFYGNNTSNCLFEKGLCLPSGSNLTPDELSRVANSVKQVFCFADKIID